MKSILQTEKWGEFKGRTAGWIHFFVDGFQILSKKLFLNKPFFYIPEPTSKNWKDDLPKVIQDLKPEVKKHNPIFIRIEPLEEKNDELENIFRNNKYIRSFEEVQPKHRQWVCIEPSEEEILKNMKPKGRYNIKVAQKHNVKIHTSTQDSLGKDLDSFYSLYEETAKRDGFSIRPKKYFQELLSMLYKNNLGFLYLAQYDHQVVASAIITFYDEVGSYLYGASSNANRNVMAPYLIHWQAIKDSKARGCKIYDLLAIAPEDDPSHKHTKLNQFKSQFGGRAVELIGGWDLVLKPFWYALFKRAQKIRRHL